MKSIVDDRGMSVDSGEVVSAMEGHEYIMPLTAYTTEELMALLYHYVPISGELFTKFLYKDFVDGDVPEEEATHFVTSMEGSAWEVFSGVATPREFIKGADKNWDEFFGLQEKCRATYHYLQIIDILLTRSRFYKLLYLGGMASDDVTALTNVLRKISEKWLQENGKVGA